jgi:ERCC4-type nuclease
MMKEITQVEPEAGQVYETRHNEHVQILYIDEEIVLLRSDTPGRNKDNTHRMERRVSFNNEIEAGHFEHKPDSGIDMMDLDEMDWSEVDYIGEKTADNLHDDGYSTTLDIQQADDGELLDVDGLGKAGLSNLRDFVR